MEKNQDGQIDKDKFQEKQTPEEKLHGENKTAECNEIGNRENENKQKDIQANTLSEWVFFKQRNLFISDFCCFYTDIFLL